MSNRDLTIEPFGDNSIAVVNHDEYPESSVLAGQCRRCIIDIFPSVKEAREQYPDAQVLEHSTRNPFGPSMPDIPPADFDPADAGETW